MVDDEIQTKLLKAIREGRSTKAELRAEIGGPLDWHTLDELAAYTETGRQISGLVVRGLAFTDHVFREPTRYKLTSQGRAALKASV